MLQHACKHIVSRDSSAVLPLNAPCVRVQQSQVRQRVLNTWVRLPVPLEHDATQLVQRYHAVGIVCLQVVLLVQR